MSWGRTEHHALGTHRPSEGLFPVLQVCAEKYIPQHSASTLGMHQLSRGLQSSSCTDAGIWHCLELLLLFSEQHQAAGPSLRLQDQKALTMLSTPSSTSL